MTARERLQVPVNDELLLDAGTCEELQGPHGIELLIRAPHTTLFHQVLAYLRGQPDPPRRPSGSMVGREGVAAAALCLRYGVSYGETLRCSSPAGRPLGDAPNPLPHRHDHP